MARAKDPLKVAIIRAAMSHFAQGKELVVRDTTPPSSPGYHLYGIDAYSFQMSVESPTGGRRHFTIRVSESM